MSADIFSLVLDYIYEGVCKAREDLLYRLLQAAGRLQIATLEISAVAAVQRGLCPSNCIETWLFAVQWSLAPLQEAAQAFVLKAFEAVSADEQFLAISREMLLAVLVSDELQAKEEDVFEALMRWLHSQSRGVQEECLPALLECVRFAIMPADFISARVESEPLMQGAVALKIFAMAMKERAFDLPSSRRTQRNILSFPPWVPPEDLLTEVVHFSLQKTSAGDEISLGAVDGRIVRLDQVMAAGRFEVNWLLTHDFSSLLDVSSCFGVVAQDADQATYTHAFSEGGRASTWCLRRFRCIVYSETTQEGEDEGAPYDDEQDPYERFPVGARVQMVVDMDAGEASFAINGEVLPYKAKGIQRPVYPYVATYGWDGAVGCEIKVIFQGLRKL